MEALHRSDSDILTFIMFVLFLITLSQVCIWLICWTFFLFTQANNWFSNANSFVFFFQIKNVCSFVQGELMCLSLFIFDRRRYRCEMFTAETLFWPIVYVMSMSYDFQNYSDVTWAPWRPKYPLLLCLWSLFSRTPRKTLKLCTTNLF